MNAQVQLWMPSFLTLLGMLIVVVLTAWLNTKALLAQMGELNAKMDALRFEFKKDLAELELRLTTRLITMDHRIEHLEEHRGLVRP